MGKVEVIFSREKARIGEQVDNVLTRDESRSKFMLKFLKRIDH